MRDPRKTQEKIHRAVQHLLEQTPMQDISVKDICKEAGVALGTFYRYYASKTEAILDISNPIDTYFDSVVRAELKDLGPRQQLECFFRHQAQFIMQYAEENQGTDSSVIVLGHADHFFSDDRLTFQMLLDILKDDALYKNWKKAYTNREIASHLLYLTRGIVLDWKGSRFAYPLEEKLWQHVLMTNPF